MFGYLKKVARIDTCRGQESVRTMSAQESSVTILPQVRLMAASTTSSLSGRSSAPPSPNVFLCEPVKSLSSTVNCDDEEGEADDGEEEGKEDGTSTGKGHKRRVHHLLPSSFLSLLPPGTPHSSGRSSCSSGFKSRPNSVSDEQTSISSIRAESPARRSKHQSRNENLKRRGHDLSNSDDQQRPQQEQLQPPVLPLNSTSRRSSSRSSRATTPTTFCPTIASALWRPLWPPGEL